MSNFRQLWWRACMAAVLSLVALSAQAAPPSAGPWQEINPTGPVLGADGAMHSASCSAIPGSDPAFRFWARKGSSKNLMVYFEGGGACWDSFSCSFPFNGIPQLPQLYSPAAPPSGSPAPSGGVFDAANPANPVRDWSTVYIPYCTADLHGGKATNTYGNAGNPFLPPAYQVRHNGFSNFMVVLDWIKKNMGSPKSLLVTGASAGGYGATLNFPWLARAYPNAHMYVLADASQGVTTPTFDGGTPGRGSWNLQFAPGAFGANPQAVLGPDLLKVAARNFRHAKVAQFTTNFDTVQIGFYGLIKAFYPPGGSCANPAIDWNQQMLGTLASYASTVPNYRYYVAEGLYHTILRSPDFYTETSAGVPFAYWVGEMLANRGGTNGVGGGWFNAACPTCLFSPPCQ